MVALFAAGEKRVQVDVGDPAESGSRCCHGCDGAAGSCPTDGCDYARRADQCRNAAWSLGHIRLTGVGLRSGACIDEFGWPA
jgi:hypothetical protein